eukprot:361619-Chlamydomonas_euryale.AAC.2
MHVDAYDLPPPGANARPVPSDTFPPTHTHIPKHSTLPTLSIHIPTGPPASLAARKHPKSLLHTSSPSLRSAHHAYRPASKPSSPQTAKIPPPHIPGLSAFRTPPRVQPR